MTTVLILQLVVSCKQLPSILFFIFNLIHPIHMFVRHRYSSFSVAISGVDFATCLAGNLTYGVT